MGICEPNATCCVLPFCLSFLPGSLCNITEKPQTRELLRATQTPLHIFQAALSQIIHVHYAPITLNTITLCSWKWETGFRSQKTAQKHLVRHRAAFFKGVGGVHISDLRRTGEGFKTHLGRKRRIKIAFHVSQNSSNNKKNHPALPELRQCQLRRT